MMKSFCFPGVGTIHYGIDAVEQLSQHVCSLHGSEVTVVLVSDAGVAQAGLVDRVAAVLRRDGLRVEIFADFHGEPRAATLDAAASFIRKFHRPCVVGLGGGSALDVAKLAAVLYLADHPAEDYALCARRLPKPVVKRVMIPTTAGTGSEVTSTAVFTTACGHKVWAWGRELLPEMVILDPKLTVKLPPEVTAACGVDAIVHAIEACTNQRRNPFTDCMAHQAIRLARKYLLAAIREPENLEARGGMLQAATLAGIAFGATGTAAAHAVGHALATVAHIPHGRAVAMGMQAIIDFNAEAAPEAFAPVAAALGAESRGEAAGPAFRNLCEQAGLELTVTADAATAARLAVAMLAPENLPMIDNNTRMITPEDAQRIAGTIVRPATATSCQAAPPTSVSLPGTLLGEGDDQVNAEKSG